MAIVNYSDSDDEENDIIVKKTQQQITKKAAIKDKFVDVTIPSFDKVKKTKPVKEKRRSSFELDDNGSEWRGIKLRAFNEKLSNQGAVYAICSQKYPDIFPPKPNARFTDNDKRQVLKMFRSVWDLSLVVCENEYTQSGNSDVWKDKWNQLVQLERM